MKYLFCCLWAGHDLPSYSANKYSVEDVLRLWRNARRFMPEVVFCVLADNTYFKAVTAALRQEENETDGYYEWHALLLDQNKSAGGWSPVMQVFDDQILESVTFGGGVDGRFLVVGLDTVFTGNFDWLFDESLPDVGLPPDPNLPTTSPPCDAVVAFSREGARICWDEHLRAMEVFKATRRYPHIYNGRPSEMALLQHLHAAHKWPLLEPIPQKLLSYKVHLQRRGQPISIPLETSIVYFHGVPKPSDLLPGDPVRKVMLG